MNEKNVFRVNLRKASVGNVLKGIITIPVTLINANLLSNIIENATSGKVSFVIKDSLIFLGIIVLSSILRSAISIYLEKEKVKVEHLCKLDFLERFLSNPLDRLFHTNYGELIENLTDDMNEVLNRHIQLYPTIITCVLGIIGYTLYLLGQSPIIIGSLVIMSLIQLIPPMIVKKYMQINYDQCEEVEAEITDHIIELVNGFEIIKMYDLKEWWQQKMSRYHKKYIRVGRKTDALAAAQRSMNRLADNLLQFGTYALIGFYVILNLCSVASAVQAIYLSTDFFSWIQELFSTIPEIAVSQNAEKRIRKWTSYEETGILQAVPISQKNDGIQVKNVSYGCDSQLLLHGITYGFEVNKNYLITGSNGAGKTTLLNLLTGLIIPNEGSIYIKGVPYGVKKKVFNPEELFYVPQIDPEYHYDVASLFKMFGNERQEKIERIAEKFGLSEIIKEKTPICELSGGERKKVFLTIGFAIESRWLLLDEPSNNLDTQGKNVLLEMIQKRKGTILISHDLLFYDKTDCILRIENGKIYEEKGKKDS